MNENLVRMREILARVQAVEDTLADAGVDPMPPFSPQTIEQAVQSLGAARKLAERVVEVQTQYERLEALCATMFTSALGAIIVIDATGIIVSWNPSAERLFGWASEEAIGKPLGDLIIPERYRARHREGFARFAATQGPSPLIGQAFRTPARHHDGHEFEVETVISAVPSRGSLQLISFSRDVSAPAQPVPHLDDLLGAHGR